MVGHQDYILETKVSGHEAEAHEVKVTQQFHISKP